MTRRPARPGVTLIEVLVTIFIMAIGMLALLVLFPIGALNMGQALKDDRCASAAALADSIATIFDIRHDANVMAAYTTPNGVNTAILGPSNGVLIDPFGVLNGSATVGSSTLPRVNTQAWGNTNAAVRWCTLLDDLTFQADGTPDLTQTPWAQRAEAFTWAWLVRQAQAGSSAVVDMSVVVFRTRDTTLPPRDVTYTATGAVNTNTATITYGASGAPNLRTGAWVLDTSASASGNNAVPGYFYRVVGYTDYGGTMQLELETNLKQNVTSLTFLDSVAEVFDRGQGWKP